MRASGSVPFSRTVTSAGQACTAKTGTASRASPVTIWSGSTSNQTILPVSTGYQPQE